MTTMKRNIKFFLRKIGDTFFLQASNKSDQTMVFMNETSAFLWEKMGTCSSVKELVSALIVEYDVQEELAEHDVMAFVAFLEENGCLVKEE